MNKYLFFITYFVFSFMQVFCQSDESSNLTYGMKLYDDKIYDVAITQFKNFLEQYGSSVSAPKVQYFLAESYMESGDKENALRNYQRLIMDYPKSEYCETSILKAAELYNETGDKEKAARYYLQLKNYFPNSNQIPESYYKAIVLFREIGMTEQVKDNTALLQKSYHDNNFTKLSQIILAGIYESENQIKLADRTFYEILRSSAGDIKTKAGLEYSLFLERQNSLSEARRILKEAFKGVSKKDRNYFPLLVRLTKMLLNSNGYDEAGKLLDGEKNIPDEFKADINSLKGELDFFKGNYSTALKFFEDALKSGIVPETEIKRAHTLNSLKEFEKAGDAFFDAAVSGAGNDQEMINYSLTGASNNYFASGNYEKGVLVLKKYLELFPHEKNSSKINFMIGRSFYDSGKYSAGYELLKNQPVNYPMSEYNDDAVFLAGECAFKMQNWRNAYDQHDYLIRNFGASEFKALSVSRLKYLNDYKIRENDLTDKLADLSSRSIFEENRSKLFFDWARFYFYDMKDYARASEFIDKYTVLLKNGDIGQEGKFIKAVCIIRLKSTEKDALRNSFEILRSILADPNTLRNLRFKAAGEMLDMAGGVYEGAELESASDNVFGILKKDQTDDIDGTLAFRYFSIKSKLTSTLSLIQSINEVFQSKTNSIYYADTELIKAELYRTGGDLANSNMILKKLSDSDNNGYPALKSLNILSEDPSESAESKIIYLSKIEDKFFYTTSFIEINERKAKVYFDDGKLERSLVLYESLNKELNKGVIASSWNFSEKDYSKNIADIYFALGELNKAETFYQKALSNRNASLDRQYILLKLAEIYKSQNNKTALEENYKALSSVSGGDSSYLAAVALADIDLEKNNITKAINQYEDILKKYKPEDRKPIEAKIIKAQFGKNSVTEGDKLIGDFRKKYKDAYDKDIYEPEFYLAKSNAYLSLKDYDKAIKGYRALLKDYPSSVLVPKSMYGEAVVLYNIGKKDEAFNIWKTLVEKYPDDDISVETNYHLGAIYNNREEFDNAITSFQSIIKYKKDHNLKKNSYKNIIDLYLKLGFNDAAAKMIREYISNYPDEDDVFQKRIEIGNIYQRNEEYDTALDYFKRLLYEAKGDDEAACQFFIAETYMMMKNFKQAITEFLKVKYMTKTDSPFEWKLTASYNTSLCYEELGEYDKALEILNEIVKNHPNDSYGRQAKKIVERIEGKKNIGR